MEEEFGRAELKAIREQLGLTQRQFASKLGVSRPFVAHMESGAKPVSVRTRLIAERLRPKALAQKPRSYDPVIRNIEQALIDNGVDFVPHFQSEGQYFDFYLPEFELGVQVEMEVGRAAARQTRDVRGILSVTGKIAATALVAALNGHPLKSVRPKTPEFEFVDD